MTNFFPEALIHSKSQDSRIVGEHYNRGNDFFGWFLGEAMVYTAAWFETPETTLEDAQYKKIDRCCEKLQLKKGETLLDIGCGWGTFVARAAREFGVEDPRRHPRARSRSTSAPTASRSTASQSRAKVEVCDYRNVPRQVRQDRQPRDGRARRHQEPRHVLREGPRPPRRRRPLRPPVDGHPRPLQPAEPAHGALAPARRSDLGALHGALHLPGRRREPAALRHAPRRRERGLRDRRTSRT